MKLHDWTLLAGIVHLSCAALGWSASDQQSVLAVGAEPFPDLLDANREDLVDGLERGRWTSVDLVEAYIRRIHEVQPELRPVLEVNPDAVAIATELDRERARGIVRSAFHGLPILVKDNMATSDRTNTTTGSRGLLGSRVPRDATVVAKLRAAGAVILGKTNLSEWSDARSSNSSSGWSAYGGQTLGAYHPKMDPCGSSSGSGVASSIGLAWAALGTETSGSILCPASHNNLVGIKPTVGLTSRALVIPISEHQDTVGPMTRSVADAAHLLSVMAGKDHYDNYTSAQPFDTPPDYSLALNISALQGARIGIPRNAINPGSQPRPVLDAFDTAVQILKDAGAMIVENANYSQTLDSELANKHGHTVFYADMVTNIPQYLAQLTENPHELKTLRDIRSYTQSHASEAYPARNTEIWDRAIDLGFNNTDPRFWEAFQFTSHLGGPGTVTGALDAFDLDALVLPTNGAWEPPAMSGLPGISVPLGSYPSDAEVVADANWDLAWEGPNIPFGVTFLGRAWSESTLIGLAYAFEQRSRARQQVQPIYRPQTQLSDVVGAGGLQ